MWSFYPLNFAKPFGPPSTRTIPILFAFTSDLAPTGKSEIERYRELDPNANVDPVFPLLCVASHGYWRFEMKQKTPGWLFHEPTSDHDEIIDFIAGFQIQFRNRYGCVGILDTETTLVKIVQVDLAKEKYNNKLQPSAESAG